MVRKKSNPNAIELSLKWQKSMYEGGERIEDGDDFESLFLRCDEALNFLQNKSETEIVVVTHSHTIRATVTRVIFQDTFTPEQFKYIEMNTRLENTGLTVLKYNQTKKSWELVMLNDYAHLGD